MNEVDYQKKVMIAAKIIGTAFFIVSGVIVYLAISFLESSPYFLKDWSGLWQGTYLFGAVTVLKLIQSFIKYALTEDKINNAVEQVMKEDQNSKSEIDDSNNEKN